MKETTFTLNVHCIREINAGEMEDWRKMADTHKISPEEMRRAGLNASRRRNNLRFSATTTAVTGLLFAGFIAYHNKNKPEVSRDADTKRREYNDELRPKKAVADPAR